jgi:hypothetical protein
MTSSHSLREDAFWLVLAASPRAASTGGQRQGTAWVLPVYMMPFISTDMLILLLPLALVRFTAESWRLSEAVGRREFTSHKCRYLWATACFVSVSTTCPFLVILYFELGDAHLLGRCSIS